MDSAQRVKELEDQLSATKKVMELDAAILALRMETENKVKELLAAGGYKSLGEYEAKRAEILGERTTKKAPRVKAAPKAGAGKRTRATVTFTKEDMEAAIKAGLTGAKMAEKWGVSQATVNNRKSDWNLTTPKK